MSVKRRGWTGGNDRAAAGPLAMKHHESWARAEIPDDGDRRLLTGKSPDVYRGRPCHACDRDGNDVINAWSPLG